MTTTASTSRTALFNALRTQWQATEVAVRQCEDAFTTPATDQWSIGDLFRHIMGLAHRVAPDLLTDVFRAGEVAPGDRDAINQREVDDFKSLSAKMVQIELGVAHATVWMFLQRYSDEDLAKQIKTPRGELAFGDYLLRLCGEHEQTHVAEAMQAAGNRLKPPAPFRPFS